ncbi:MAG TPA: phage holin family protein [Candidatus Ozemobacteraceae bacterium]
MIAMLVRVVLGGIAVLALPKIVPGIKIRDFPSALKLVVVMSLIGYGVNMLLGFFTLGLWWLFSWLSFGILALIVNAFALDFASDLVGGVEVDSFSSALLGALVLTVIWGLLRWLVLFG